MGSRSQVLGPRSTGRCRNQKHRFSLRTKAEKHVRKSRETRSPNRIQEFGVAPRGPISTVVSVALSPAGGPQGSNFLVTSEIWSSFSGALFHIEFGQKCSKFGCSKRGPSTISGCCTLGPGPPLEALPMRAIRTYLHRS